MLVTNTSSLSFEEIMRYAELGLLGVDVSSYLPEAYEEGHSVGWGEGYNEGLKFWEE